MSPYGRNHPDEIATSPARRDSRNDGLCEERTGFLACHCEPEGRSNPARNRLRHPDEIATVTCGDLVMTPFRARHCESEGRRTVSYALRGFGIPGTAQPNAECGTRNAELFRPYGRWVATAFHNPHSALKKGGVLDYNLPSQDGNLPSQEGNPPSQEGNLPSQEGNLPSQEGNLPSQEGNPPSQEGNPRSQDRRSGAYAYKP